MSKELAFPDNPQKTVQLDPNIWSYRDFMEFSKLMSKDAIQAYSKAQEIVTAWDYDGHPRADNAIAKLPLGEGAKVVRTIMETLNKALEAVSSNDVQVDFTSAGWSLITIVKFYEALSSFDYVTIEGMVHEAATLEGVNKGETLPLVEGVKMVAAIQERHKAIMSGKS